jgi:hypothetical protein
VGWTGWGSLYDMVNGGELGRNGNSGGGADTRSLAVAWGS